MKVKVSDYIANFYASKGIDVAFVLTGGCIIHFIDSIAKHDRIKYIPMLHEQSAAMAADAYARISDKPGLAATTSGPGATNLLTGICCAYYDSIPLIAITGQVSAKFLKNDLPTRQFGFQETDVKSIYQSVTKYSSLVTDPQKIRFELEKSFYIANSGRKGPVLLDITEDVLFGYVEEDNLEGFTALEDEYKSNLYNNELTKIREQVINSKRPVLVLGAGATEASNEEVVKAAQKLGIPVLLTWGAYHLSAYLGELFCGGFGVTSPRSGNFLIQNSDLIIAIGTRFDTHEIGSNVDLFAPKAKRVVIDIDQGEIDKLKKIGFQIDLEICISSNKFINLINNPDFKLPSIDRNVWFQMNINWINKYPICHSSHKSQKTLVNPYYFFKKLGKVLPDRCVVVTDCGSNLIWTMQSLIPRNGQRIISAFNHSPMGYSIAGSIGAFFAKPEGPPIVCIIGDGGFQINVQELAVISRHNLNIKIFVMNNHCHGIIQGTQNAWLEGRHHAACPIDGKLPDPDVKKIANAYDINTFHLENHENIDVIFKKVFANKSPNLIDVSMLEKSQIEPKLMYGRSIEDSHPLLSREELSQNLI